MKTELISMLDAIEQGEPLLKLPSWGPHEYIDIGRLDGQITMQIHAPRAEMSVKPTKFLVPIDQADKVWEVCKH